MLGKLKTVKGTIEVISIIASILKSNKYKKAYTIFTSDTLLGGGGTNDTKSMFINGKK